MGRPEKHFDWKVLDAILQFKASKRDCAELINISEDTIERRIKKKFQLTFSEYRDRKMAQPRHSIARRQYEIAMAGNATMLIWLGKQWLGQTEKQEIDQTTTAKIVIEQADKDL